MHRGKELLPYLVYCDIVAWLLKARGVVIPVPHNNPYLMQDDSTNQLICALHLNHDGADGVGGLKTNNKKEKKMLYNTVEIVEF